MKELVIISGKGGTGKTSITASLAALAHGAVLADCDVDAANLHLVLKPDVQRREQFTGGAGAHVRQQDCIACGACLARCRYDAVLRSGGAGDGEFRIDPLQCEGCGVCVEFCPVAAIDLRPKTSGEWFVSETRHGPMVHARLGIGEENSGKLVTIVRRQAARIAGERGLGLVIVDGPPGIACPVIASVGGASLALLVTEPTMSGLHDLRRVMELVAHFGVPAAVCINKFDINPEMAEDIRQYCAEHNVEVAGELPYDAAVTQAQLAATSIVEHGESAASIAIVRMWKHVAAALEG
jgi:MinD superfamily P-loop ATPase